MIKQVIPAVHRAVCDICHNSVSSDTIPGTWIIIILEWQDEGKKLDCCTECIDNGIQLPKGKELKKLLGLPDY